MALTVNANLTHPSTARSRAQAVISWEAAAYALVILLAVILRIAELDSVPLREAEARQALAAWRVVQPVEGLVPIAPQSSLLFSGHVIAFSLLGASEFSARIFTVLASLALVLSPLLFRDLLGVGRAFVLTVLLSASPILLISSRTDSSMIWSALMVALGLWAFWRYLVSGRAAWAVLTTILLALLILLTDPTGLLTAGMVLLAGYLAWRSVPKELDGLPNERREALGALLTERLNLWPRLPSILIGAAVTLLVSTLFLAYPAGLNVIGEGLLVFVRGLTTGQPGLPIFFAPLTALFYEPWLLMLGIAAWIWLRNADRLTLLDRFMALLAVLGLIVSALYRGSGADHALWITLPLAVLVSGLVMLLLDAVLPDPVWGDVPPWARWLVALVGFFLLSMFSVHLQTLGRSLLQAPDSILQPGTINSISLVWVILTLVFMLISFFLAASVWRVSVTLRGALLALLAFGLMTSLGSGWRAAVYTADNAAEWWNREAVSREVHLLRQTIIEVASRETGGEPTVLPVAVLAPQDGEVAWALRDVRDIAFISDLSEGRTLPIVILPETPEPPNLDGPYVGKSFLIRQVWDASTLQPLEFLSWYLQRRVRQPAIPDERVVLWLRQDIYDGVPFEAQP
jgi:4-amino-4-deoxy-L-arabinose transferase-like glycosyltransferase